MEGVIAGRERWLWLLDMQIKHTLASRTKKQPKQSKAAAALHYAQASYALSDNIKFVA
jgi:hypothetical protein